MLGDNSLTITLLTTKFSDYLIESIKSTIIAAKNAGLTKLYLILNAGEASNYLFKKINNVLKISDIFSVEIPDKNKILRIYEAWNYCRQICRTKYLHIMHDDDILSKYFYTELISLSEKYKNFEIYATSRAAIGSKNYVVIHPYGKWNKAWEIFAMFNPFAASEVIFDCNAIPDFQEDLNYCGDWRAWLTAALNDKIATTNEVLHFYRFHKSSTREQNQRQCRDIKEIYDTLVWVNNTIQKVKGYYFDFSRYTSALEEPFREAVAKAEKEKDSLIANKLFNLIRLPGFPFRLQLLCYEKLTKLALEIDYKPDELFLNTTNTKYNPPDIVIKISDETSVSDLDCLSLFKELPSSLKKRILFYSDEPGYGGVGHYVDSLLRGVIKRGHEVWSAQPEWKSPMLDAQRELGVKHIWTGFNPVEEFGRSLTDLEDARRVISEVQPDVIFFVDCCPISNLAAKEVAFQSGVPFVSSCHIDAPYLAERFQKYLADVHRHFLYATEAITVSESALMTLRNHFGLSQYKGKVIYNGRPEKYFADVDQSSRETVLKELNLPSEAVVCFTAARIIHEKGFDLQIEAISELARGGNLGNLHFVWAGEGNFLKELKDIVVSKGLQQRVKLLGYRWDLVKWLEACDIFVLPSRLEAMPLCVMEAMAKGKPVVASAVAGIPEELGEAGILLPDPNKDSKATVKELVRVLPVLANDIQMRRQLGQAARCRALKLFREEEMWRQTIPLIEEAASEGPNWVACRRFCALARVDHKVKEILVEYRKKLEVVQEIPKELEIPEFGEDEIQEIRSLIESWSKDPSNQEIVNQLRVLRQKVASFLVNQKDEIAPLLLQKSLGQIYRLILKSGFAEVPETEEEKGVRKYLAGGFDDQGNFHFLRLAAAMLFDLAHRYPVMGALELIPNWFIKDYLEWLFTGPSVLTMENEADRYVRHLESSLEEVLWRLDKPESLSIDPLEIGKCVTSKLNLFYAYPSRHSNRELMKLRALLIEKTLQLAGAKLDGPQISFEPQIKPRKGNRWRIGVLNAHFGHQTETYVTLPILHLPEERFEVLLFAGMANPDSVEQYCKRLSDIFVVLPEGISNQVEMIRRAELDALIIGTNVTAVTNFVSLIAAHRMAPLQILSHCSPTTSGFRNVDGFLTGVLAWDPDWSKNEFHERLIVLDGPPVCLDYQVEVGKGSNSLCRSELGLSDNKILFFNAASCFKIPMDLIRIWAKLLREVPESQLALMPYNPNWSHNFPVWNFQNTFNQVLEEEGIESSRVKFLKSVYSRQELKPYVALADIYLDTFPFVGSISTVDPLELGVPVVACDGMTTRSRCSGAQMRALGLGEWVARDEEEYFEIAFELARNKELRLNLSQKIKSAMAARPKFLDPEYYGQQLGELLEILLTKGWDALPKPRAYEERRKPRIRKGWWNSFKSGEEIENNVKNFCETVDKFNEITKKTMAVEIAFEKEETKPIAEATDKKESEVKYTELQGEFVEEKSVEELLKLAHEALKESRLIQAEDLARIVVQREPENAEAWAILGQLARDSGDLEFAADLFQQAHLLKTEEYSFALDYAKTLHMQQKHKEAVDAFSRTLKIRSTSEAHLGLAISLEALQNYSEAEKEFELAIKLAETENEKHNARLLFSQFLSQQGRMDEAISYAHEALDYEPNSLDSYLCLARIYLKDQKLTQALQILSRAEKKFPNSFEPLYEQAIIYLSLSRAEEAVDILRRATTIETQNGMLWFQLGYALQVLGRKTEALKAYNKAELSGLKTFELFLNSGAILKEKENYFEAARCFTKAIELNPNSSIALNNLGTVCIHMGMTTEAIECFNKALELDPNLEHAHSNLGQLLHLSGRAKEALPHYYKALEINPNLPEAIHSYLLCTLYQEDWTPEKIFEEHRKYTQNLGVNSKKPTNRKPIKRKTLASNERVRIAYVSPDFCGHPVSYFVEPLLANHNKKTFEVFALSDVRKSDEITERLRKLPEHWHATSQLNASDFLQLLDSLEIDILVELAGHTSHNRLRDLYYQPVPIQISYLGYPATTACPGIQFRITDMWADPPGETEHLYTERLIRLSRCAWCYTPHPASPSINRTPPHVRNGYITFGCFNNLAKINPPLLECWLKILQAVPESHLFLKSKHLADEGVKKFYLDWFTSKGISDKRIRLLKFEQKTADHLNRYNEVDIALDTFPYQGTTTTIESLWMGVPVVSQFGSEHRSRVSVSLLNAIGHTELLASNPDEYISKVIELANDPSQIQNYRSTLRSCLINSQLVDRQSFINALEKEYLNLLEQN
ncbi:MAG: tetratricopeptide repeat protein [Chthoniobacterales bacterium]|nr:tetratricopeptide repeat protein [Chthoniobacterales bacterium]